MSSPLSNISSWEFRQTNLGLGKFGFEGAFCGESSPISKIKVNQYDINANDQFLNLISLGNSEVLIEVSGSVGGTVNAGVKLQVTGVADYSEFESNKIIQFPVKCINTFGLPDECVACHLVSGWAYLIRTSANISSRNNPVEFVSDNISTDWETTKEEPVVSPAKVTMTETFDSSWNL